MNVHEYRATAMADWLDKAAVQLEKLGLFNEAKVNKTKAAKIRKHMKEPNRPDEG